MVYETAIREVGQRVAEGGQLPIEDRSHPGLARVDHQIAEPEVAVMNRHLFRTRVLRGEPRHELIHCCAARQLGCRVLP